MAARLTALTKDFLTVLVTLSVCSTCLCNETTTLFTTFDTTYYTDNVFENTTDIIYIIDGSNETDTNETFFTNTTVNSTFVAALDNGIVENLMGNIPFFLIAIAIVSLSNLYQSAVSSRRAGDKVVQKSTIWSSFSWIYEKIRFQSNRLYQMDTEVDYLRIQLLLLGLTFLASTFSFSAGLINFFSRSSKRQGWFERTTMSNLHGQTWQAWVLVCFIVIPLAIASLAIVRRYADNMKKEYYSVIVHPADYEGEEAPLTSQKWKQVIKWCIVNAGLLAFCIVGSSLAILAQSLAMNILSNSPETRPLSPYLTEVLPTVVQEVTRRFLVQLMRLSIYRPARAPKKASTEYMLKVFIYYYLSYIVLPTFGLSSLKALVDNAKEVQHWERLFLPDNGAIFVNFVITIAFLGGAFDLVPIFDLILYAYERLKWCWGEHAESFPEKFSMTNDGFFEEGLAEMVANFVLIIMYSISCPLITLAGLVYFPIKICVTRFQLSNKGVSSYYENTGRQCRRMLRIALVIIILAYPLLQLTMFGFWWLRKGLDDTLSFIALINFAVLLLVSMAWSLPILYPADKSILKLITFRQIKQTKSQKSEPVTLEINELEGVDVCKKDFILV